MKTETLRTVSPRRTFKDGQFAAALAERGYPCQLEAGCKVTLPVSLIQRMEAASAEFTEPSTTAQEARIIPKYIAPPNAMAQKRQRLENQYKNEQRVECICLRGSHSTPHADGDILLEMEISNYPVAFYLDEVRSLPVSLVKRLVDAGTCSTDSSRIQQAKKGIYVAQYLGHVESWREAQIAIREQAELDAQPKPPQLSQITLEVLSELKAAGLW